MRTSKMLLVIVAIFIAALLIIVTVLVPNGTGLFISLLLTASIIAIFYLAKYIGETTPQNLVEGKEYIFIGADNQKGWLFLEEHIHNDAVMPNINIPNTSLDGTFNQSPMALPEEDYDLPGIYRGEMFNFGITPGTKVIAKKEGGKIGILKAA